MMMEMGKVEDQMYHWRRFPEEALEKIRNDYHWLGVAIEMLEWVLGEDEEINLRRVESSQKREKEKFRG